MGCTKIKQQEKPPNPIVNPPQVVNQDLPEKKDSEYEYDSEESPQSISEEIKAAPLSHQVIPPSFPSKQFNHHESNEAIFSDLSNSDAIEIKNTCQKVNKEHDLTANKEFSAEKYN